MTGLPNHWDIVTIEQIAKPVAGAIRIGPFGSALKKHEYADSGVRVLGIEDVFPNQLVSTRVKYIPKAKYHELTQYTVERGDLLVTNMGTVGRTCVVPDDLEASIISSHLIKVSLNERKAWPPYVSWALNFCPSVLSQIQLRCHGAIMAGFNSSLLKQLRLPLPPLPEQRRIAEILDKADALRAKRRATLAQLDTLTQSIFLDMFGDPATVLHRWPVSKLGEHLEFLTSGSRGWAKHYSERGDLFLRIQNVRRDELSLDDIAYVTAPDTAEARRTRVEAGDVLLSITADLGRTAVVPKGLGNAFINQHLAILRTKSFVPRFLSAFLASPTGRSQVLRQNRQAVKAGLNFDDIRGFVVPFPPVTIQRKFEAMAAAVGASQRAQREALTRLDSLLASLQHCALRGDLKPGLGEVPEETRDVGS